ncbi:MAG: TlyA family RNA methyltransferase [Kiritimatiellia bacterium]|jgi:23S rRNA (cytidine1920-2'-O)/16S rRNA (cytidine1409-2'-O)-methyltransferase
MNPKERLDVLVAARGLAESREQAQRLILAGDIRVNGHPATKAGQRYPPDIGIERVAPPRFVSRGGEKLEGAFAAFALDVAGLDCLDVGASTGGFTDCMLQHGAARVIALDVGHAQLHGKIRRDPRVTVIEGFNARFLTAADIPYRPHFATADVSFISLKLILPRMAEVLLPGGQAVTLIKPQFEAGRAQAPRGVVRDPAVREAVCQAIRRFGVEELSLEWKGLAPSPLAGPRGNVEFLAWWGKPA